MSYVVNPSESVVNPVGTQELSDGVPTPNALLTQASEQMHESALRDPEFKAAVTEAVSDMFALKPNWKPKHEKVKFIIQCPSGQTVLAKHLNTMDLLEANLVEDLDFFTKRLFPTNIDDTGNPVDDDGENTLWKVLGDIEKRRKFIDLLNRLLDISIEKPKVIDDGIFVATKDDGSQFLITGAEMTEEDYIKIKGHPLKVPGTNETYASAVDFTDKMAIFGELNKPLSVIQPFRGESVIGVANVEAVESSRS